MIEVSGRVSPARLSTAASLLRRAQQEGETTAWIQASSGGLFPPDLAAAGVDLEALVVIHTPADRGAQAMLQAAEWLLRSGAYELASRSDVPGRVVITEYVDVARAFFDSDAAGMVNAVLDKLARSSRPAEFAAREGT